MDTLVLAIFVSNSLIAVYEVAWNLASLFAIFGSSISRTLFPEISKLSSEKGIGGESILFTSEGRHTRFALVS
jgi:O-antigen/teichoic acid export membrane protein